MISSCASSSLVSEAHDLPVIGHAMLFREFMVVMWAPIGWGGHMNVVVTLSPGIPQRKPSTEYWPSMILSSEKQVTESEHGRVNCAAPSIQ